MTITSWEKERKRCWFVSVSFGERTEEEKEIIARFAIRLENVKHLTIGRFSMKINVEKNRNKIETFSIIYHRLFFRSCLLDEKKSVEAIFFYLQRTGRKMVISIFKQHRHDTTNESFSGHWTLFERTNRCQPVESWNEKKILVVKRSFSSFNEFSYLIFTAR